MKHSTLNNNKGFIMKPETTSNEDKSQTDYKLLSNHFEINELEERVEFYQWRDQGSGPFDP